MPGAFVAGQIARLRFAEALALLGAIELDFKITKTARCSKLPSIRLPLLNHR
jgi:hypothetical protein